MQETNPLPKIELIGTGTRRVAGTTVRQEKHLPGRDGFRGGTQTGHQGGTHFHYVAAIGQADLL